MAIPPRDGPAFEGENALTDTQAEEKLLALLPSDEGDNSEAEGEHADETETLEAEDEPQDTLGTAEASDDQDLIFDETEEDAQEAPATDSVSITWDDGTTRELTADEIRNGYLRREDYDRKQAERARAEEAAAQAKQSYEAKTTAMDGLLAELSRLKETGLPTPPAPELAREDPAEYIAKKAEYDAKIAVVQQAQQQAEAERAQQLEEVKRANAEKLLAAIPEWQDVQRQTQDLAELNEMGVRAGYWTQEAFNEGLSTVPHWQIELWRDGMRYRKAVARRNGKTNGAAPVTKRVTKVQPTVRSQASQPQSARPRQAEADAWKRFRDNPGGAGHENLAIEALLASAERKTGARRRRG